MQAFFQWIARAASNGEDPSAARILNFFLIPTLVCVPMVVWAYLSLHGHDKQSLDGSVTGFATPIILALLAHQYLNKREETKDTALSNHEETKAP